ncbi:MAG: uncharacterized protein QOI76_109 [Frankiales bacterium]|nr:uncharacterized protein [Frankiales bacterium]
MSRLRSRDLFPTDAPVAADRLIGRAADVAALHADLAAGVHQVVLGPRRTGKTSVCRSALDALADDGTYVVALDLFSLGSLAELAAALVAGTVGNRGATARGVRKVRAAGRALAGLASMTLTSKMQAELGQDVEIAFTPSLAARNPEGSLDYALGLLQRIAETDDRQLVVFFDEFQEIAHPRRPFGDPDALTKKMRAVLQDSPRVTVLFTGSVDHLMSELFVPAHRAFHRFGVTRRLATIAESDWLAGLASRFGDDGVVAADGALEGVLARSLGHARTTMLIAQQAHLALVTAGSHRLDAQVVEEGFFAALAADAVGHQSETERIRDLGGAALTTARRLARGERPYTGMPRRQVDTALTRLVDMGMVQRTGRGDYRFTDPLLAHYLDRL